jgi:hypothetical protein
MCPHGLCWEDISPCQSQFEGWLAICRHRSSASPRPPTPGLLDSLMAVLPGDTGSCDTLPTLEVTSRPTGSGRSLGIPPSSPDQVSKGGDGVGDGLGAGVLEFPAADRRLSEADGAKHGLTNARHWAVEVKRIAPPPAVWTVRSGSGIWSPAPDAAPSGATPTPCRRWRSPRTAAGWPPPATTTRSGSGIRSQDPASRPHVSQDRCATSSGAE